MPTDAQKHHYAGSLGWLVDHSYKLSGETKLVVQIDGREVDVQHLQLTGDRLVLS